MGLFRLTVSWYSIFYLIVSECVRDKPKKSGNGYGGGNGTGNDNSNSDIIITMGTTDRRSNNPYFNNGNNFKISDNSNNNIFGDGDGIEENGRHTGARSISRGSKLQNRNHGLGICKIVDFEPIGRNPWEKDEAFWYHGGIIGTTLIQGCMFFLFSFFFFLLFTFYFFLCVFFLFFVVSFLFILLWFVVCGFCNFL